MRTTTQVTGDSVLVELRFDRLTVQVSANEAREAMRQLQHFFFARGGTDADFAPSCDVDYSSVSALYPIVDVP